MPCLLLVLVIQCFNIAKEAHQRAFCFIQWEHIVPLLHTQIMRSTSTDLVMLTFPRFMYVQYWWSPQKYNCEGFFSHFNLNVGTRIQSQVWKAFLFAQVSFMLWTYDRSLLMCCVFIKKSHAIHCTVACHSSEFYEVSSQNWSQICFNTRTYTSKVQYR